MDILPGGSGASALTKSCDPASKTCLVLNKKGTLDNGLLAQTITLGLNLRIDGSIGNLTLDRGWLTTQKRLDCSEGSGLVQPVCDAYGKLTTDPFRYYKLPEVVLCYLEKNGYGLTVQGLYQLANDALGRVIR